MHPVKVVVLACLAVFMLGTVASAVASAAELPEFTTATAGTGTIGEANLL